MPEVSISCGTRGQTEVRLRLAGGFNAANALARWRRPAGAPRRRWARRPARGAVRAWRSGAGQRADGARRPRPDFAWWSTMRTRRLPWRRCSSSCGGDLRTAVGGLRVGGERDREKRGAWAGSRRGWPTWSSSRRGSARRGSHEDRRGDRAAAEAAGAPAAPPCTSSRSRRGDRLRHRARSPGTRCCSPARVTSKPSRPQPARCPGRAGRGGGGTAARLGSRPG